MRLTDPPPYTCSSIDAAISLLEELRKDNHLLRKCCEERDERISELEDEIGSLQKEIETLEAE